MDVEKKLKRQKVGNIISKTFTILFLSIMALIIIIPFYWMLNTSFKTAGEVERDVPTLYPHKWTFDNFRIAFLGKKKVELNDLNKRLAILPGKIDEQEKEVTNLKKVANYDENKAKINEIDEKAKKFEESLDATFINDGKLKYSDEYINKLMLKDATGYSYYAYLKNKNEYNEVRAKIKKLNGDLSGKNTKLKDLEDELQKLTPGTPEYIAKNNEITLVKNEIESIKLKKSNLEVSVNTFKEYEKTNKTKIESDKKEYEKFESNQKDKYSNEYFEIHEKIFEYEKAKSILDNLKTELNDTKAKIAARENSPSDSFWKYMMNTLIVGITSTILGTFLSIIGAFALSRLKFKGRDIVFTIMMATMMIPGEMMVISNYITVSRAGWTKNSVAFTGSPFFAMVVPFLVTVFHIYLLRQNFRQIPDELYYAAKVDGCSDFKYLWRVMVPLAKSSIITITILKVMGAWNAYIWPNLVGGSEQYALITVWLRSTFTDSTGRIAVEQQMAATVIVLIPLLLVFIFLRKYIMRGVSRGGTKG